MSVIRPSRSTSSERQTEKRAVSVIRSSPFSLQVAKTASLPQVEAEPDPYAPVDWKSGELITADRLNQTDAGVDKNADAIKALQAAQPQNIPTSYIDNLF